MKDKMFLVTATFAAVMLIASCGGGYGSSATNSAPTSTVQVTMGDAPGDAVVSFSVSVDSIVLTNTSGETVSLLSEPTRVELTHLAGTTTPIATVDIPQGTYTQVAIAVSSPEAVVVRPLDGVTVTRSWTFSATRTIALNPALDLGGTAVNLNLDLSVGDSVSVSSTGDVTFNPRFLVRHGRINRDFVPPHLRPITGRVEAVSGDVFAVGVRFGQATVRIVTGERTEWVGVSGIGSLTPGMLVNVFAVFGEDGRLFAAKVIVAPEPGRVGVEGLVKSVEGSPATQFSIITHDGIGGLPRWLAGRTLKVNVGGSTVFRIDAEGLDLGALPFAAGFDAGSLKPGQALKVHAPLPPVAITEDSLTTFALNATQVTLEAQPVAGEVTGFSGGDTFTLALAPESAMARLTGTTTLPVWMQSGKTTLLGPVSGGSVTLANGQRAIVRGLLFVDGGQYKLVATHIVVLQ
jgi:hypothetical protein